MKTTLAAAAALLSITMSARAHRLDEYLQATLISVEKDRVELQVRLTPGVAVLPIVLASIDRDADGVISDSEQRAYAERVLRDFSLTIDGGRLIPKLVAMKFPAIAEMKEGLGEIQLAFRADLPRRGPNRRLVFENHHQSQFAAYLVNCLVPRDLDIRLVAQTRNDSQAFYQLDYVQTGGRSDSRGVLAGAAALLLFVRLTSVWRQRS